MKRLIRSVLLLTIPCLAFTSHARDIPLQLQDQNWQILNYQRIPANQVNQLDQGLHIQVKSSASPLIYIFDEPVLLSSIKVIGKMGDLPIIPEGHLQGDEGADDFPFRLGLVLEGDKTLNFAERLIAAQWVKILFDLAPDDTGIDHIRFLNLANPGELDWQNREHPAGKGLFTETIIKQVKPHQPFDLDYTPARPERVLALWISADGDDTQSEYAFSINSISYN